MSIPKLSIQEANSHLRRLHKKVFELENRIQMQALHVDELQKANQQLQQQLSSITATGHDSGQQLGEKDQAISELTLRLEESENRVQQLLEAAQERDSTVLKLEAKARLFYEAVEHRSSLARILEVLEELSTQGEGGEGKEGDEEGGDNMVSTTGGRGEGVGGEGEEEEERGEGGAKRSEEKGSQETGAEVKIQNVST